MPMALKQDVLHAMRRAGQDKPIDLVHLGHQTMGDEALEGELLGIFASQSRIYLDMMRKAGEDAARRRAAHSMKGAARAIGAFQLAERAADFEATGGEYLPVERELKRVLAYIAGVEPTI